LLSMYDSDVDLYSRRFTSQAWKSQLNITRVVLAV